MKNRILLPVLIFISLIFSGCTQNNGNVGDLFGSWVLDSMTVDGQTAELPDAFYTTWSFQGEILMVTAVDQYHSVDKHYGTFIHSSRILKLDFVHHSDAIPEGTGIYSAPEWLGFPAAGVFELTVDDLSGKHMVLSWTAPSGKSYIYKFSKTW